MIYIRVIKSAVLYFNMILIPKEHLQLSYKGDLCKYQID